MAASLETSPFSGHSYSIGASHFQEQQQQPPVRREIVTGAQYNGRQYIPHAERRIPYEGVAGRTPPDYEGEIGGGAIDRNEDVDVDRFEESEFDIVELANKILPILGLLLGAALAIGMPYLVGQYMWLHSATLFEIGPSIALITAIQVLAFSLISPPEDFHDLILPASIIASGFILPIVIPALNAVPGIFLAKESYDAL